MYEKKNTVMAFWVNIFIKNKKKNNPKNRKRTLRQGIEWFVPRTYEIIALGYVSCTKQIAALRFVSRTNHITVMGYLAPIRALLFPIMSRNQE